MIRVRESDKERPLYPSGFHAASTGLATRSCELVVYNNKECKAINSRYNEAMMMGLLMGTHERYTLD